MGTPKRADPSQVWNPEVPAEDTSAPSITVGLSPADWGCTEAEARAMLERQSCPVCGTGPWKSPLNHVSRKHGIDRFTMRDICGLTTTDRVVDPALGQHFSEQRKGKDMSALHAGPRRKQRWTKAGLAKNAATIAEENSKPDAHARSLAALAASRTPKARAKQAESMRAHWAKATDEERRAVAERLARSPEELSAMQIAAWDRRGRQGCGTVASYKRGCRCAECRDAKRASRLTSTESSAEGAME